MAGKEKFELGAGAFRQRRNLLLVAGTLIVLNLAQVEFGSSIRLFGVDAIIRNPEVIPTLLKIALAYFLWRFFKYWHVDEACGEIRRQFNDIVRGKLDREIQSQVFSARNDRTSLSGKVDYNNIEKIDWRTYAVTVHWNPPGPTGAKEEERIRIDAPKVEKKRIAAAFGFAFRGRILSDFLVPYGMAVYAAWLSF